MKFGGVEYTYTTTATIENLKFYKGSTEILENTVVDYTGITLKWDNVPNIERYQIKVIAPDETSQASRYTGTPTFGLSDTTRYGYFGTQE